MKIVKLNAALTAVFVIITVLAVVVFNAPLRRLVAIVDLVLFAIGVAAFIWGYFSAVQRSRSDEISVAALVNIDASGSLSIDQSLSRLESPSVNSFKASVGKFDGAKLIADEKSDVQLLGIEDIASSGTRVEPNVFFALPIKSDSPTSQPQLLMTTTNG